MRRTQARFLVYREMIRAGGASGPCPESDGSVCRAPWGSGAVGARHGRAGAVGGRVASGSWLAGLFSWKAGPRRGPSARGRYAAWRLEFQRTIDSVSWLVGLAVFLTWWGPYLMGLVNLVLLGLFPFVMLWALIPGTQFQPLAQYFVALLFTSSMPLWWALVDVACAGRRGAGATSSQDVLLSSSATAVTAMAWSTVVTVLGILLVPVVTAILMFSVFRAVGQSLARDRCNVHGKETPDADTSSNASTPAQDRPCTSRAPQRGAVAR